MTRKNRGWVWICRDANVGSSYRIYAGRARPKLKITTNVDWDNRSMKKCYAEWRGRGFLLSMCAQGFEKVMRYRLPPGACEKVRISLVSLFDRTTLVR